MILRPPPGDLERSELTLLIWEINPQIVPMSPKMKPAAYLETSNIGHLASRLSRDLLTAAHQQLTHAAVHGVDYLLTWNCAHIANAQRRDAIEQVCRNNGYEPPLICTPEELLGEQ